MIRDSLPGSGSRRLVLLTGVRQTGKTTLTRRACPGMWFINLDAPENRKTLGVISSSNRSRDEGAAAIDEA